MMKQLMAATFTSLLLRVTLAAASGQSLPWGDGNPVHMADWLNGCNGAVLVFLSDQPVGKAKQLSFGMAGAAADSDT